MSPEGPPPPCRHDTRTLLGSDGSADFFRCGGCGDLLVEQGPRLWRIRGRESPA